MKLLLAILLFLFLLLQYSLWFGKGSVLEVLHLKSSIKEQQAENAELKERNQALEGEVKDLKTGLDAIEERARSELGMVKKGEIFYQLVEKPEEQKAEAGE